MPIAGAPPLVGNSQYRYLYLRVGHRLDFVVETKGSLRVLLITGSVKRLEGILPKPPWPLTLGAMDEAIAKRAAGD